MKITTYKKIIAILLISSFSQVVYANASSAQLQQISQIQATNTNIEFVWIHGGFGVQALLINTGEISIENVLWGMSVGYAGSHHGEYYPVKDVSGIISRLDPGETITIRTGYFPTIFHPMNFAYAEAEDTNGYIIGISAKVCNLGPMFFILERY
jgi:hypothetical protein